ncbi:MAG: molybdenum cofactor guanylyltransferase MobA [Alphaproteobacteria bacterium]|nr:molybdenum cofactor guanylyltransferase MobA [Alphaproteobacteria bacterium]
MKPPCVILAGGRSSRMGGGDKCLLPLDGKPMLAHVLDRVSPQVCAILINSNSAPDVFASFGWPVLPDVLAGFQGPLAGLLTGMAWAAQAGATHVLSVACDTPFLPPDLSQRLGAGLSRGDIAIARDDARSHPVIGLWPTALAPRLARDMEQNGIRGVHQWLRGQSVREVSFDAAHFRNINTRDELNQAFQSTPYFHLRERTQ